MSDVFLIAAPAVLFISILAFAKQVYLDKIVCTLEDNYCSYSRDFCVSFLPKYFLMTTHAL